MGPKRKLVSCEWTTWVEVGLESHELAIVEGSLKTEELACENSLRKGPGAM